MNSIVWKNIDSKDIEGLIICELPPISKPKMRTKETCVDGVDGSTFEDLGFETYDKTIQIGLRGNFDIDEIIEYFSGEGNLILSNESDKYYKARIIDQIDYDRLLRFRTANVRFKVQPFKYSNDENVKLFEITNQTSLNIFNNGNYKSKPIIKICGSGTIEFKQEGITIFNYSFPENDTYVVIDSDKQDAYVNDALKNRNMLGDFPVLKIGKNIVSWTGTITKIEVSNYSRFL